MFAILTMRSGDGERGSKELSRQAKKKKEKIETTKR